MIDDYCTFPLSEQVSELILLQPFQSTGLFVTSLLASGV